jgi:hypothetical protein
MHDHDLILHHLLRVLEKLVRQYEDLGRTIQEQKLAIAEFKKCKPPS